MVVMMCTLQMADDGVKEVRDILAPGILLLILSCCCKSGYLKTPARSHRTSLAPQESTPSMKLTKSGNIDKRSLRGKRSLDR